MKQKLPYLLIFLGFLLSTNLGFAQTVFINEIHYDNVGGDTNERIEIAGPAGTDLTGWKLMLYNGSGGTEYATETLTEIIPDSGTGFGYIVVSPSSFQNGPDGIALIDNADNVIQFLSYEAAFMAVGGPADGMMSTEIGVEESGTTPADFSLQLGGEGTEYTDFTWQTELASTFGEVNANQQLGTVQPIVFINEIHYDNAGTDTGEAIEIVATAGTDLSGYSLVLYNGSNGASYSTENLSGIVADEQSGYGFTVIYPGSFQNGSPDGLALVDPEGNVLQFLSYEGSFTATNGPASGMTSTDIGVEESGSEFNSSLQLGGQGLKYEDFSWQAEQLGTFGSVNTNQLFEEGTVDPEPEPVNGIAFINELHYDNDSSDTGEAVEIAGTAGLNLNGYTLVFYNGNGGAIYKSQDLSGMLPDQDNGYGTLSFEVSGIQNGAPDGLALVDPAGAVIQFLSYEGTFTAVEGPAAGMESTDIGVAEPGNTSAGYSLQLAGEGSFYEDFSWTGPITNTFGAVNTNQKFVQPVPVLFVNELHYDNSGGDVGEGIEVAGTAGLDLTGYSIAFYNGNGGDVYKTENLSGVLPNQDNGYGTLSFEVSGIQNGAPDGLALINPEGNVIQFLSYEGSFVATSGPAAGLESTDIGVTEPGPVEYSLQLQGTGKVYEDFTWIGPVPNTFGSVNSRQSFGEPTLEPEKIISIAEAREKADEQIVTVAGTFTVVNEIGGPAYIQDKTGAIAIYDENIFENENFKIGDSIKLTAIKTTYFEQVELVSAIEIVDLGEATQPIVPKEISLSELYQYPGQLVQVSNIQFAEEEIGKLVRGGENFRISDASGDGDLRIDHDTKDLLYGVIPESCSSVTGIAADVYFNIIPRSSDDFSCLEKFDGDNGLDISYDQTLDVVTWNLEFFGFYKNNSAPAPEAIQKEAVKSRIIELNADLIAVEEVVNVELFAEMVSELEGYDFILSDAVSYPNSNDPEFGTQRIGFIYKTDVIDVKESKVLLESIHPYYNGDDRSFITDASYPTGDADQFWSSGRLPFLIETTVTLDGQSQDYDFIVIHAKSGSSAEDYQRREFDNKVLKDSLDTYYAGSNLMVLGDFNDDIDQTIADTYATASSYYEFINSEDYEFVTRRLSEEGFNSTLNYSDIIDHIMISDELSDNYVEGSASVRYDLYTADYGSTASDHFAVSARFSLFESADNGKNNPDMVQVCFNGHTQFVSENAVANLLKKGAVLGKCEGTQELYATPNPVESTTIISLEGFKNGQAKLNIYSLSGNLLASERIQVKNATAELELNMSGYLPGLYIIQVQNSFGQLETIKVVKK